MFEIWKKQNEDFADAQGERDGEVVRELPWRVWYAIKHLDKVGRMGCHYKPRLMAWHGSTNLCAPALLLGGQVVHRDSGWHF